MRTFSRQYAALADTLEGQCLQMLKNEDRLSLDSTYRSFWLKQMHAANVTRMTNYFEMIRDPCFFASFHKGRVVNASHVTGFNEAVLADERSC